MTCCFHGAIMREVDRQCYLGAGLILVAFRAVELHGMLIKLT